VQRSGTPAPNYAKFSSPEGATDNYVLSVAPSGLLVFLAFFAGVALRSAPACNFSFRNGCRIAIFFVNLQQRFYGLNPFNALIITL